MVMNYSEVESKVREATNDDQWGPHGSLMGDIAKYTFTYEYYPEAMSMVWKRMFESRKNWRRIYKVSLSTTITLYSKMKRTCPTPDQSKKCTLCVTISLLC